MSKTSSTSRPQLPFRIVSDDGDRANVTAYAGLPLVIEAMRSLVEKRVYRRLRNALGYSAWRTVRRHLESLVVLVVAGGECIDDLRTLRADAGLARLLGFRLSSPTQAKQFLYRFHQDPKGVPLDRAADERLSVAGKAQIRPEGRGLSALDDIVLAVVRAVAAVRTVERATLDVDATIIEASKELALRTYEGPRGYQPQMAWSRTLASLGFRRLRTGPSAPSGSSMSSATATSPRPSASRPSSNAPSRGCRPA